MAVEQTNDDGRESASVSSSEGEKTQGFADREGLPTGEGTASRDDVADPHPSNEEQYDKVRNPGGAQPPPVGPDIGQNSYAHDGTPQPGPKDKSGNHS